MILILVDIDCGSFITQTMKDLLPYLLREFPDEPLLRDARSFGWRDWSTEKLYGSGGTRRKQLTREEESRGNEISRRRTLILLLSGKVIDREQDQRSSSHN